MARKSDLSSLQPDTDTYLAVGKFDGVHLGHYHLLAPMARAARAVGARSAVITLHPNPLEVLAPGRRVEYLVPIEARTERLSQLGIDDVIVKTFDAAVAQTPARTFVDDILKHVRMKQLWAGPGFALGKGREGTVDFLRDLGRELGYSVHIVEPLFIGGDVVSGTRIRHLLRAGAIAEAGILLGRLPRLPGIVVRGAGRGHDLGFPTANIEPPPKLVIPANGIYAVRAEFAGEIFPGVASIGVRPTFEADGQRTIEVHIFDFDRDVYGTDLELEFVARLRDELRFDRVEALVEQMDRDVRNARQILSNPTSSEAAMNDQNFTFEEIGHTAEIGLRVSGHDLAELFANAARGMWSLIVPDIETIEPNITRTVELEAMDAEVLLVDWLSEHLYLHETEREVYSRFEIEGLSATQLQAKIHGRPAEDVRLAKHIKAVTFNELSIEETDTGFSATIVFDV
jgi:riboflavin kinase/FMN adenylyltransferase